MQHVSADAFRPVSATDRKAVALAAYDAALISPHGADWQAVAHLLRAALPAARARAAASEAAAPAWWADYALPRVYRQQSLAVLFVDGTEMRVNLHTAGRKPARVAKACRVAIAFYRARHGEIAVPRFASLTVCDDGRTFDADECSRLTADLRAAPVPVVAKARAVTAEAVERMAAEVERRRAGLTRSITAYAEFQASGGGVFRGALPDDWRAAVIAGEAELAKMRAAVAPADAMSISATTIEAAKTDMPVASIVPAEINAAPVEAIAALTPAEAIASEPASATEPEIAADLSTDAVSHPVVAICGSMQARRRLTARLEDDTQHVWGNRAKGGAFRITLADAERCASIRGVRLTRMPRKSRSKPADRQEPAPAVSARLIAVRALVASLAMPGACNDPFGAILPVVRCAA